MEIRSKSDVRIAPYIFRHADRYHVKRAVPKALQRAFGWRKMLYAIIDARSDSEAKRAAVPHLAKFHEAIEAARSPQQEFHLMLQLRENREKQGRLIRQLCSR